MFWGFPLIWATGTESEVSYSVGNRGGLLNLTKSSALSKGSSRRGSSSGAQVRLLPQQGNASQVKIAAINGKPRVQRYLSRECE